MSDLVSLCIVRIEMEEESVDGTRKDDDIQLAEDVRISQKITVETYASKLAGPLDLRLLPASSREGSQAPLEDETTGQDDGKECEEVDFFFGNPLVEVTKGILHLYKENELTDASVEAPSRTLCLLAVPATVCCRDLLAFTAACQRDIQHVRILRDSSPDRYMALLTFRSRGAAYEFRETFGGAAYSSLEPGTVCHAAWVRRVECMRGAAHPPPPPSATELPTCPVCLERMDESVEGLLTVQCAHSFHTGCLGAWRDGSCPVCRCAQSPDPPAASECAQCAAQGGSDEAGEGGALWICLICGHVGCGRYQAGHAAQHFRVSNHTYAMQLGTNRVWDYAGDNFVHRLLQNKTDGKLVAAGGPGDPDACSPAAQEKLDSIQLECAHLLATQLDAQRRHYEEVIAREKAAAEKENHVLKEKLEENERQLSQLSKKMANLTSKVSILQTKLTEEKAMAEAAVRAREELSAKASGGEAEIADLREQVRDLAFYVQAANAISNREDCQELREGQVGLSPQEPKGRRRKKR